MTILIRFRKTLSFGVFVLGIFGCSSNGSDPVPVDDGKDREVILTHWVDNIIIPSYAEFKAKLDFMLDKGNAFTTSPDNTSLLEFRSAWVDAYAQWQKVELFEFGPADKYTLRNFFNIYPADVAGIAANISDPSISLDLPNAYARQGFPALDYLLNGVGNDDADILAFYSTGPEAAKRIDYIERLNGRMNTLVTNVITEWNGEYRSTFISKTGLDIGSSMGLVVNAYVLYYERYVRTGKFGIPSGAAVASAGVPNPEKMEAYYKKDISQTLAKNANTAAANFFNGVSVLTDVEGPSFASYLNALEAKDTSTGTMLSVIINDQFDEVNAKLDLLSPNLYEEIQTNNQAMINVYTAMQKMVRILKVDMTSAMSVTITYTDNDGD
ncbi:MAG: peptidase M75, Imelysin [Marivirga sp.]|nr:peptidase M75, Imelysin [Marivirga sp.]